ncbi:MAG: aldo/keto reductase [candidate division Zixibacteria bacterium]|nr:aldo/keto reductase [candidate division Zixibacteria bacterium]
MGSDAVSKITRLGLGTVQFGIDYGVSNQEGQTPPDEIARILELSSHAGIRVLDTAMAYGDSEQVLGLSLPREHDFKIVTKTEPIGHARITRRDAFVLTTTFQRSLQHLKSDRIYGLLVHQADDLLADGGELLFEAMEKLRSQQLVEKIGVSVYTGEQIDLILDRYPINIVQLPINIFDQHLLSGGYIQKLKEAGVEIHARSVFLQGLLLMNPASLPPYFETVKDHLAKFHNTVLASGQSVLGAALDFVLGLAQIDSAIVGVCSRDHLAEIISSVESGEIAEIDYSQFALDDENITNPANWKVDQYEGETC